jgi:Tfp pilus assembly protein PilZ
VINYFDNLRNVQALNFDLDSEIHEPNRRKEQRKACLIPAHYKIKRQLYSSFILDINEAGAFIETDRPFPIGEKVILKFLDPWSRRSALINGSIVWSSDAAIGIKFGYHLFTPF